MIVSGNNIYCDACKININIPGGFYTCDQSCNWDLCKDCYEAMKTGSGVNLA